MTAPVERVAVNPGGGVLIPDTGEATENVALADLKQHLNIDASFIEDDALIKAYAAAAEAAIAADLNVAGIDALKDEKGDLPEQLRLAIMMLTAHFYASREPVVYGVTTATVPLTLEYLVAPFRCFRNTKEV